MLIEHAGKRPTVHASAWVAPNAVICGDVTIGPESRVLFGAVVTAETGAISIGAHCVVMEHAVVRASRRAATAIGDHVLVGPHAHLTGCTIGDCAFLATRSSVFNGAHVGERAEVRIGGVVHVNSRLEPDATVPIGWVAVGDPASVLPPEKHDDIWTIQRDLDFPGTVFGLERAPAGESLMPEMTRRYARALGAHREDRTLD
jgi:carbonic anhydrase/acetyltransferase-like protein (isoleucine patch superfamily)